MAEGASAPFIGIRRHRIGRDGEGVTTLAAFHGCPLRCRYCLNPQSTDPAAKTRQLTPAELYELVRRDAVYFLATGGGMCFGGGEPCLRPGFIREFRELCGPKWRITLETSLAVPAENVEALLPVVDHWIVDIKDMNPDIYRSYTGCDNAQAIGNLRLLAQAGADVVVRTPLIKGYNTRADVIASGKAVRDMGFSRINAFAYAVRQGEGGKQ